VAARRLVDVRKRLLELVHVASGRQDERRPRGADPEREVLRAQLLGARQRDRAQPPRAQQREHPLGAGAHQRHHHVAAAEAEARQAGRGRGGLGGHFSEGERAHRAVRAHGAQRLVGGSLAREALDHVAREVESGAGQGARCYAEAPGYFG
jgi:hypothetical protein